MPSNLLQADVGFPQFKEEQKPDEKINQVVNYLYMLLEQLRYSFGNLGTENFSESGITELEHLITDPIYARLENEEGQISELTVNYDGLYARLYNNTTGDITKLTARADVLEADMYSEDGRVATLTLTVDGLSTTINDPTTGALARITANENAITQKVEQGDINSSISQFASSISLAVTNSANKSQIQISGNGITAEAKDIMITGMVRFETLGAEAYNANEYYAVGDQCTYGGYLYTCTQAGSGHTPGPYSNYWTQTASASFINGGNIKTGSITADLVGAGTLASTSNDSLINLKGYLGVKNSNGTSIGYLGTYESASATVFGMYYDGLLGGGVTVKSDSANMGVGNAGISVIRGSTANQYVSLGLYDGTQGTLIFRRTAIEPGTNGVMSLGTTSYGWSAAYFKCGASMGAVLGAAGSGVDNGRYIWLGGTTYGSGCGFAVDLYNQRLILTNGSAWRKFDFSTNTWGSL